MERQTFAAEASYAPQDRFGMNLWRDIVRLADLVARCRHPGARKNLPGALHLLQEAVAAEDALVHNEPHDWYFPVREALGGTLLRSGRPDDSAQAFRDDLTRTRGNGRSLFGLWCALEAQGKAWEAVWVRRQFEQAWALSDTALSADDL